MSKQTKTRFDRCIEAMKAAAALLAAIAAVVAVVKGSTPETWVDPIAPPRVAAATGAARGGVDARRLKGKPRRPRGPAIRD
jgi:hypothetical protein